MKEKIVRQVGHPPELYEDARSEKYKTYFCPLLDGYFIKPSCQV